MKKGVKIISAVLAFALVISIGTAVLISNAEDNSRKTQITLTVDKTELKTGEGAVVTVKATTNYAVGTISIPVFYDKTLTDVSDCSAPLSEYANNTVTTDLTAVDTAKIYANTGVDSKKYGFVLVNYIAGAGKTVKTMLNGEAVLTFKLTAKADVKGEAVIKVITESAKTDSNSQGMLYFGAQPDGNIINALPENVKKIDVTNASSSVYVGNGLPYLSAIGGTAAVVDNENKYVYGITVGEDISDLFAVTNGKINIVPNELGVTNGTGATVQLLDLSDNVTDSYTIIIFGDVNGDGVVSGADYTFALNAVGGAKLTENSSTFACDMNGDGEISGADYTLILNAVSGADISNNPYA